VASAGELAHIFAKADPSSDPAIPEGKGLVGHAFRTGEYCISEDVLNDHRLQLWRPLAESAGLGKAAAFPFLCKGQPVGVISYLFSQNSGELGAEVMEFLSRIAEILSLGMEIAEREERRRAEEEAKDRMARMLAALSATNEAMTKCVRIRLPSWTIASTCRLKAMISASTPTARAIETPRFSSSKRSRVRAMVRPPVSLNPVGRPVSASSRMPMRSARSPSCRCRTVTRKAD